MRMRAVQRGSSGHLGEIKFGRVRFGFLGFDSGAQQMWVWGLGFRI